MVSDRDCWSHICEMLKCYRMNQDSVVGSNDEMYRFGEWMLLFESNLGLKFLFLTSRDCITELVLK
jgi:hypothetical protein